jgi:hypothetical protein
MPKRRIQKRVRIEVPSNREDLLRAVRLRAVKKGIDARKVAERAIEQAFLPELEELGKN